MVQVLGDNAAEAETLFKGEPESALVAAILWAFEVCHHNVSRYLCTSVFLTA